MLLFDEATIFGSNCGRYEQRSVLVLELTNIPYAKFVLPDGVEVNHRILKLVGEKEKEYQRELGPLEWFMGAHQDKDGSYHEPMSQKFMAWVVKPRSSVRGKENVQFSIPHILIHLHVDNQNVSGWKKTNVTGSSNLKELNITQTLNFDQLKTIIGLHKSYMSQISKKHVSVTNDVGNSMMIGDGHVT
ncbi:hypothetical protein Cgig2_012978 [Carnegiea gigantea]|uniref:Uncharacterized protein n=1 Tax=Carnegiea gigantea TaxID=171969 RepID=A0A9Q1GPS5_9CARY|nr:hypothetical protein Cgig2_012978 [Carnegiea gigantea]